jgi:hypothetical protein
MFGGILLILLEIAHPETVSQTMVTVFSSIFDPSILCGLLIMIGGVLVLLESSTLGAVMSIIFGLYPSPLYASHAYDILKPAHATTLTLNNAPAILAAVVIGSLPIIGGLMALASARKIRR